VHFKQKHKSVHNQIAAAIISSSWQIKNKSETEIMQNAIEERDNERTKCEE